MIFLQSVTTTLEIKAARGAHDRHDPFWIDLSLDVAKPRHVPTIDVLQRSAENRVIRVHRHVRHILAIRKRDVVDRVLALSRSGLAIVSSSEALDQ